MFSNVTKSIYFVLSYMHKQGYMFVCVFSVCLRVSFCGWQTCTICLSFINRGCEVHKTVTAVSCSLMFL